MRTARPTPGQLLLVKGQVLLEVGDADIEKAQRAERRRHPKLSSLAPVARRVQPKRRAGTAYRRVCIHGGDRLLSVEKLPTGAAHLHLGQPNEARRGPGDQANLILQTQWLLHLGLRSSF